MKKVVLQGHLGDKYGMHWSMKADSFAEVFACIEANYPGFRQDLINMAEAGGDLDISVNGLDIQAEQMFHPFSEEEVIVITPIPTGAKSGGAKIFAAVALVVAAFVFAPVLGASGALTALAAGQFGWTAAALLVTFGVAASLALAGLEQIMAPDASVDDDERDYLFTQGENTVLRGNPVPVLLGEMIVGGVVISSGIKSGIFSARGGTGHSSSGSYGGNTSGSYEDAGDTAVILPGGYEGSIDGLYDSLIEGNGGVATTQDLHEQILETERYGQGFGGGNINPGDFALPGAYQGISGFSGRDIMDIAVNLSHEIENTDIAKNELNVTITGD